jgi:protein arginine kinase activator
MTCEKCGKNPAQVRYTEYREGASKKLLICFDCAKDLGFEIQEAEEEVPVFPEELPGTEVHLVAPKLTPTLRAVPEKERCPGCGLTSSELQRLSRFGCARCYETFAAALDGWLQKVHGATRHRGRVPRRLESP